LQGGMVLGQAVIEPAQLVPIHPRCSRFDDVVLLPLSVTFEASFVKLARLAT
jgi:hypothetical protein